MTYVRNALIAGLLLCNLAHAAPQHALTLYNEPPKYPADFKHTDYVNPDAPKGGTFRESSLTGFDSFNPFISKGVPAATMITPPSPPKASTNPSPNTAWWPARSKKPRTTAGCASTCAPKRASTTATRCAPTTWYSASRP